MSWFAAVFLPQFHLQAFLRLREEKWNEPIAIVEGETIKGHILELTDSAARAGVRQGMPSPQAMARCPDLQSCQRSLTREETISALLVETAGTLSPFIESTAPDLCLLDLRWLKTTDWQSWTNNVVTQFEHLKLRVKVGLASNPDLAVLAARRKERTLIVKDTPEFLSGIGLEELGAAPELIAVLRDWGIKYLGDLTRLSRPEVVERLGPEAGKLWDCATGGTQRQLRLVRPLEIFAESFEFDNPIETTEPLLFILRRILDQLTTRLRQTYRVAAKMVLSLTLENGAPYQRTFVIPSPTLEVDVLFRILHTHLEDLSLEQRPVSLRLEVEPTSREERQFHLFESQLRDPNGFSETLARLHALAGVGNVGVIELEDTYQPDRFRLVEPKFEEESSSKTRTDDQMIGLPLHRFRPPFSAQVQLTHHLPAWVFSEKAYGEIIDVGGPYRVSGEWWDRNAWNTEEWDVELDSGALYRLSKQNECWFVEGCYDAPLH